MDIELFNKDKIFSVSELTELIKEMLEKPFSFITVEGEISSVSRAASSHLYFTLKDESAAINAVIFKNERAKITFDINDGIKVKARGKLSVYASRGTYQLIVFSMEKAGEGEILAMLEERKKRLMKEGLFDKAKKKALPFFPRRIALITSASGAAVRDILRTVRRRNKKVSVVIINTLVQGEEAAAKITEAIKLVNEAKLGDVLILARGGGSTEDLLPFSDEALVRALAASAIPTVSAVGHEIDFALSDFAADLRAPTPTAAAELTVPLLSDMEKRIALSKSSLLQSMNQNLEQKKLRLSRFSREALLLSFRSHLSPLVLRKEEAKKKIEEDLKEKILSLKSRLILLKSRIEERNPKRIMSRGFALVTSVNGKRIVKDASSVEKGETLLVTLYKGSLSATVDSVKKE